MLFTSKLVAFVAFTFSVAQVHGDAASYAATQDPISKAGVLANIGATGSKVAGAKAGIVVASPSKSNPDYFYTWTRDASLVLKVLIDRYTQGRDTTLLKTITDYVDSQKIIQQVSNPSGTVSTGGLGEAKYNVDETAFTGGWGRPQRDGPATRATSLITFANYLISKGNTSYPTNTIWPLVKLDVDYVAQYWNNTGFDLWEEVSGSSFYTIAVQHRSLREGAAFATAQGDATRASTYTTQAARVLCFLQSFWSGSSSAIIANVNVNNGRSGLDANTILGIIHTFDPAASPSDVATFQPASDKALLNHYTTVNSFRGSLYPINSGIAQSAAVNLGRYKEDVYYNGNPWYLATLAAGEQLYYALYQWNKAGSIQITATSLPFWTALVPSAAVGSYASTSATYTTLTSAVKTYADGFLLLVQKYQGSGGALAEQYLRATGAPTSAADLTWSYAAALTAFDALNNKVPATWGAAGLTSPTTCTSGGSTPGGGSGTVAVTFKETATTVLGENIYLTGSVDALQNWSPDNALLLSSASYPVWSITVNLPASTAVQYKFIRKYNGAVTWESDPNRQITTPASGTYTENDSWR